MYQIFQASGLRDSISHFPSTGEDILKFTIHRWKTSFLFTLDKPRQNVRDIERVAWHLGVPGLSPCRHHEEVVSLLKSWCRHVECASDLSMKYFNCLWFVELRFPQSCK